MIAIRHAGLRATAVVVLPWLALLLVWLASLAWFMTDTEYSRVDVDAGWIAGVVERAEPVIRSDFDVYHDGDRLLYTGAECGDEDLAPPFFLHVFPEDEDDLPAGHREHGFHHLDFRFEARRLPLDLHFKDVPAPGGVKCIALVDLPGYEMARIRTGQYVPDGPVLWEGEIG